MVLSLRERAWEGGDVMCSQTMMSSTEILQGFKVTKAFSVAACTSASGLVREQHPGTQGNFIEENKWMHEMRAKST